MPNPLKNAYLHQMPIEPGECLPSWLLRISNRNHPNFRQFSTSWLSDKLRVTPGFDAFPAANLLMQLGAIYPDQLDHYVTHHTLLGTTKCFYTEQEWKALISIHTVGLSRISTLHRTTKQQSWHICPTCRNLELARGIAIWQVLPQVPGVLYCFIHGEPLVMRTATRIPPYDAPSKDDLPPETVIGSSICIGREEDHVTLALDISDALKTGLSHRSPGESLRDTLGVSLFGRPCPQHPA